MPEIQLKVNDDVVSVDVPPWVSLLDLLRETLGATRPSAVRRHKAAVPSGPRQSMVCPPACPTRALPRCCTSIRTGTVTVARCSICVSPHW